jgi:hypothetical protein
MFLNNGQILIGVLKGISLGKVDFDADDVDVGTVKTSKIKTISAKSHIYKLETIHNRTIYTVLLPSAPDSVQIQIGSVLENLAIAEIGTLLTLKGKGEGLWEGYASAGYTFTRSTLIGQLNASLTLQYSMKHIVTYASGSMITTQTDSSFDFTNANATLYSSYLLNGRWQVLALLSYQRNLELSLARRYQEGAAAGYTFISSRSWRGLGIVGPVLSQEKNTEGEVEPTQLELPFIIKFDFFHFRQPDMTASLTNDVIAGITQLGRVRQDATFNISWKIAKDFNINLKLYDNYDNQPPGKTGAAVDYGVVFGLSYSFFQ